MNNQKFQIGDKVKLLTKPRTQQPFTFGANGAPMVGGIYEVNGSTLSQNITLKNFPVYFEGELTGYIAERFELVEKPVEFKVGNKVFLETEPHLYEIGYISGEKIELVGILNLWWPAKSIRLAKVARRYWNCREDVPVDKQVWLRFSESEAATWSQITEISEEGITRCGYTITWDTISNYEYSFDCKNWQKCEIVTYS